MLSERPMEPFQSQQNKQNRVQAQNQRKRQFDHAPGAAENQIIVPKKRKVLDFLCSTLLDVIIPSRRQVSPPVAPDFTFTAHSLALSKPRSTSSPSPCSGLPLPTDPVYKVSHPPSPCPVAKEFQRHTLLNGVWDTQGFIEAGGYGEVYRAQHIHTGQMAAIKFQKQDKGNDPAARFEKAFYQTLAVKRANGNPLPWAPNILEAGFDQDCGIWIAMELLSQSLWELSAVQHRPQVMPHLRHLMKGALSAVEALHNHGYIHRDVKLDNFVLRYNNTSSTSTTQQPHLGLPQAAPPTVVLIDYGLVISIQKANTLKSSDSFYGTTNYAADEALLMRKPTVAHDLESLAYAFWELLNGMSVPWGACSSNVAAYLEYIEPTPKTASQPDSPAPDALLTPNSLKEEQKRQKERKSRRMKRAVVLERAEMFEEVDDVPEWLFDWLVHCKSIRGGEPEYSKLYALLEKAPLPEWSIAGMATTHEQ